MTCAAARCDGDIAALVHAVQYNCDVSDARHAREGALCTYLLGMRELYRWSVGAPAGALLDRNAVGAFIATREAAWDTLFDAAASYRDLPLDAGVGAFDEAKIDAALRSRRLAYGGGIGRFGAPVFFLAERLRETVHAGVTVVYAGAELARGIVAPPALSRGKRAVVRTDAMRRWLWTRAESAAPRAVPTGLAALLAAHGGTTADAIERVVADQADTLALHEVGEVRAGELLGGDWEQMLSALADRRAESLVRAVRDLLADCLVTLPALVEREAAPSLRFWFANLEGLRRSLSPRLAALLPAHADHRAAIVDAAGSDRLRHYATALDLLDRWRSGGAASVRTAAGELLDSVHAN